MSEPLIYTYYQYLLTSKIHDIIITDRKKVRGFVVFENFETYPINQIDTLDGMQNLIGWLKHNAYFRRFDEECFDFHAIASDILNVCYKKDYKPKKLPYSQILFNIPGGRQQLVFDCTSLSCTPLLYPCMDHAIFVENPDSINLDFINGFMSAFVADEDFLHDFKVLCRSVFVHPSNTPIVLTDWYCGYNEVYALYAWLKDVVVRFHGRKAMFDCIAPSQINRHNPPRLVIVYQHEVFLSKEVFIRRLIQRNVTNIIWVSKNPRAHNARYRVQQAKRVLYGQIGMDTFNFDTYLEQQSHFLLSMLHWCLT